MSMTNTAKPPEKFKNIFMEETSAKNPYGPNYSPLPYNAKIAYKFNKMKGYVKPSKQDLIKKEDEDSKFMGTLMMGFALGGLLGGCGRIFLQAIIPSLRRGFHYNEHIYYPIIISVTTSWAYFRAYDRYYEEVAKYFVNKYLSQAIENGFQDYDISK